MEDGLKYMKIQYSCVLCIKYMVNKMFKIWG